MTATFLAVQCLRTCALTLGWLRLRQPPSLRFSARTPALLPLVGCGYGQPSSLRPISATASAAPPGLQELITLSL